LLPGRGIPGLGMPWLELNGLLPGLGIDRPASSAEAVAGFSAGGSGATTGAAGSGAETAASLSAGAAGAVFFGAGGASTVFWTGTTPSSAKAAFSFRTTGGSTVEEGPLTNSPISLSFSRVRLLSMPSSVAISCTRGFPATTLLSGCSPVRAHRYLSRGLISSHS
jgi:hypothetical protein